MRRKIFSTLISCMVVTASVAQTSVLQDKSGETSLLVKNKTLSVNAADASATLGITDLKNNHFFSGSFKFGSTEGIATLLDGDKFNPEMSITFSGGWDVTPTTGSNYGFVYLSGELKNSKFSLLKQDNSNLFEKNTFTGLTGTVGYNGLGAFGSSSFIFGGALKYGSVNNLEDLESVETFSTATVISGSTTLVSQTDKKKGFQGNYQKYEALKFNLDAYLYPKFLGGRLGVGGYLRSQLTGLNKKNDMGVGVIFGEEKAPANVVFGVLYQFVDVFNQLGKEHAFFRRGGINIVAGYNF